MTTDDGTIAAGIEAEHPPHRYESLSGVNYCRHCGAPQFANIHDSTSPYSPPGALWTDQDVTPREFRDELSRLYATALAKGLVSQDVADAAGYPRRRLLQWIGGYCLPASATEATAILSAVATKLGLR